MKLANGVALTVTLAVGVSAQHNHNHNRHHARLFAGQVEKREAATVTVVEAGPTVVAYELEGESLGEAKAEQGIKDGYYIVVGSSEPTMTSPSAAPVEPTSTAAPLDGVFLEQQEETTTKETPTTTKEPTSTKEAAPTTETTKASATKESESESESTGATGLDADFPDGEISCDEFPSDYGAVALAHLDQGGWAGIQRTPGYTLGDSSISSIDTGIAGDSCVDNSFCSYACPPGYEKSQWPEAQGSTAQSIGGLYCNNGKLYRTRDGYKKLCEAGVGGVKIKNSLSDVVSVCRTDYPGHEGMVIPIVSEPGEEYPLTNPDASTYYQWEGQPTTAQYYVNKKGYGLTDSCVWDSPLDPEGAGNWAPVNLGTGRDAYGITYLSVFLNTPTTTADLDFKVRITGDVSIECTYNNGAFNHGDGNGCTTAISDGGEATIEFYE